MGNIFDEGISALKSVLESSAERPIQYSRGNACWTINATRGSVSFGTVSRIGGIPLEVDYREYIVRVEALPTGIIPQNRDVIQDESDRWETFNMQGKTCYRYCDPGKKLMRIYTRRI